MLCPVWRSISSFISCSLALKRSAAMDEFFKSSSGDCGVTGAVIEGDVLADDVVVRHSSGNDFKDSVVR
jgi:hypothetical protein